MLSRITPHDNVVDDHSCDGWRKSNELRVCHKLQSTDSGQMQAFQDKLRAYFGHFSNSFQFFFLEVVVVQTWS